MNNNKRNTPPPPTNKAFTLIELLVVVLIIGILAAIALPQYQKTIAKTRLSEAIINLNALLTAEEAYYLERGNYGAIEDLNIQAPESEYFKYSIISDETAQSYIAAESKKTPYFRLEFWFKNSSTRASERICYYGNNTQIKVACEALGCKPRGDKFCSF